MPCGIRSEITDISGYTRFTMQSRADPADMTPEEFRSVRDQIERKVREQLTSLDDTP
jgi:hypothetical protein